ncbi:MAG: bifunctional 4-hydroxy-2-oxoglutarate aldolase/2-dehydro-3-deoxy-phosphogluconate aldolase [Lachnospiraceae bacterium]|nr:bifunctional 4-hydroxy-2-oxoglutarate aldolase/2-dehydro-3-deoxy-phosphogluconate aldolase [Lachnospiraceae bacterium]
MNREEVKELVFRKKVIAIVRGIYGDDCLKLADALFKGGIRLMEVTFDQSRPETFSTTADTIRQLTAAFGGRMVFGAGTVTSTELAELTKKAGGQFIVSPDTKPEVIRKTVELDMVSIPGAFTPTEIALAYESGADFVKVFPAGTVGPAYIKAVRAPLSQIPLLAVGGVGEADAADYIAAGASGVGVGGNLAKKALVEAGRFDEIEATARALVKAVGAE